MHLEVVRHKALTQRTAGFLIPILRNLGIVNQKSGSLVFSRSSLEGSKGAKTVLKGKKRVLL